MGIRESILDVQSRMRYLLPVSKLERIKTRRCIGEVTPLDGILPSSISLVYKVKKIYDQGRTNSCTACAICAAFSIMNDKDISFRPSRYYIYAREREMETDIRVTPVSLVDTGAYEIDGLHWCETTGICSESKWPSTKDINDIPPASCDKDACRHRINRIVSVPISIDHIRNVLSKGHPVLIAIYVYSSIADEHVTSTGIVPMPLPDDVSLGGHEVVMVGYDDDTRMFLIANSWGTNWGCQPQDASTRGYLWLPYDYALNHSISLYTFDSVICI